MRFHVDTWDPAYGSSVDAAETASSTARIDPEVEVPASRWAPIPATAVPRPAAILFVDGIRRVDARVWIEEPLLDPDTGEVLGTQTGMGLCASYGSGVVCSCQRGAHLLSALTRRGLFTTVAGAEDVTTTAGTYRAHHTGDRGEENPALLLSGALQHHLTDLEIIAAAEARNGLRDQNGLSDHDGLGGHDVDAEDSLVVVDGPLRGRTSLADTIGYIKSHRTTYLPPALHAVIARLGAGERTPIFAMGTSWDRLSWYLRLPSADGAPWVGVVRVECAAELDPQAAVRLANLSQAVLPRYASTEYKDHRAPQNLTPIAGLERELRRRLGDPLVIDRALRRAAFSR